MLVLELSPWAFGWDALVAIGTGLLALATVFLAAWTARLAGRTAEEVKHSAQLVLVGQAQADSAQRALEAANEQVVLAQQSLAGQIRPVIIDVPPTSELGLVDRVTYPGRADAVSVPSGTVHAWSNDKELLVSVPLRNAGTGLAMIRGISLEVDTEGPPLPVLILPTNLPPGESGRVSFRATPDHQMFAPVSAALRPEGSLTVRVGYADLTGNQMVTTRFDLRHRPQIDGGWFVRQIHFQRLGEAEPFAGSGPVA